MFSLKNHPFDVETFFKTSVVLTFAVPKDQLENLIPECLSLDTFQDKYAFIAVALVDTKNLRPKGFPEFLGNDFILAGFRIFVRYENNNGRKLRGLYILKSETNKKKMAFFGNIFTHYNYSTTDIQFEKEKEKTLITSKRSGINISFSKNENEIELPQNSPFTSWKEARRFAGPLPFTFTYNKEKKEVLIIEGVRKNWDPQPISVSSYEIGFLKSLNLHEVVLANAFIVENIPYFWKKGKIEKWKG